MLASSVDEASRDGSSIAVSQALIGLVVLMVVASCLAWRLRDLRRSRRSFVAWMSGFAPVALILAVTLLRDGLPSAIALLKP